MTEEPSEPCTKDRLAATRPHAPRVGRVPTVFLLIAIVLALLAWPIARYLMPEPLRGAKGPFQYPGITWVMLDRVPGRYGSFYLVANVTWHEPHITASEAEQFTRRLVEETMDRYARYQVRVFDPGQRLLVETWSDKTGGLINVKPGESPLKGPIEVPGMTWLAVGTAESDNATKPRLAVEVKFDDPEVVSVPYVECVLGRLVWKTRGRYADYYVHAYNHKDDLVLEMWANGTGTRFRSLPKDAYYNQ